MNNVKTTNIDRATVDAGRVKLGAGWKMTPVVPASIKDAGRVKVGAGWRLIPHR